MAYVEKIYTMPRCIDHEFSYAGDYGAKGQKRQKKEKATPEQIEKQNQKNRQNYVRRLILNNFVRGDIWLTLKYPKGTRFTDSSVMVKDMRSFIRKLRKVYRSRDQELKYIYRMEIGKKGAPHVHILINRIRGEPGMMEVLQSTWPYGFNETPYEGETRTRELADYLTKKPEKEARTQLSFFPEDEWEKFIRFQSSRNLKKPEQVRKEYKRRTLRKLFIEGPTPREGYYIDKNSIVSGINPVTGLSYYRYTEILIKPSTERRNI